MQQLTRMIERAAARVERGRRIVDRQREHIANGTGLSDAMHLLRAFERSQAIFEDDLDRLILERDGER